MDEEELRGPVLGVLGRLLLPDLAQVPHVEAAVGPGGGQDRLVVGGPLDLLRRRELCLETRQGCQTPRNEEMPLLWWKNAPNVEGLLKKCPTHKNGAFFPSFIAF